MLLFFFLFQEEHRFYIFYFIFYCCSITVVQIFPPLLSIALPTPHSLSQSPPCCLCPWVLYTCSLTRPLPLLSPVFPSPLSPGHCPFVLYFYVAGSVLLLFIVCFVYHIKLIGEIIYLPFDAWLISLSIMLSRSIYAVEKGRSSFFLSAAYYSIV